MTFWNSELLQYAKVDKIQNYPNVLHLARFKDTPVYSMVIIISFETDGK